MKWLDLFSLTFWLNLLDARLYLGGGGSGPSAEMGNWSEGLRGPWSGLIDRAIEHSEQPYQSFFGATGMSRTPGLNSDQNEAMNYTRNMARMSSSPLGSMDGARAGIEDTLGGQYLGQNPGAQQTDNPWNAVNNDWATVGNWYNNATNPYALNQTKQLGPSNPMLGSPYQNPYADKANEFTGLGDNANPYSGQQINTGGMFSAQPTQAGTNAFQGMDSPYFRQMTQQGMGDLVTAHQNGAAANTNRMAALSGAFGGSAHQQMMANDQAGLDKSLNNYLLGAQNSQYDRSAGLDESRLGRAFQGQQFDTSTGAQSFENAAQRGMQGQQFGMGLGSQNYENALNRGFQGQESQYGRGYGSNESDIARRFGGTEAGIDRTIASGQFDRNLAAGSYEQMLNRSNSNVENYLNRASGARESQIGRGNQGWEMGQDRASNAFEGERNRMMQGIGAGQNEQNLAYQRIASMMGIGDFQRGVQGQQTDEAYQNWFNERNYNQNADAWLAGILGTAQGGLPASQSQPGASPWANAIGTGLAAYGMFR